MVENFKFRWTVVIVSIVIGVLWILPNFTTLPEKWWFSTKKLSMGLDIQGGIQLVMGVDAESVIREKTSRMVSNLEAEMKNDQIPYSSIKIADEKTHTIEIGFASDKDKQALQDHLSRIYSTVLQVVDSSNQKLTVRYFDAYILEARKQIVNQAIEVIRNRVDEFGVAEPSIAAQGTDRIIVQLPGVKDSARAKDLINRTARLEFRVVSTELDGAALDKLVTDAETAGKYKLGENEMAYQAYVKKVNEDLKGKLPANTRVVFEKLDNAVTLEAGKRPYLIKTDSNLSGDQLEDAFVSYSQYGRPEVSFRLNVEGTKLFAEMSGNNVGGFIAILLDDVVKSAPQVKNAITGGSAVITLGSGNPQDSLNEAQFIATTLRAGALPAALSQLEERSVGPTLGAESIARGKKGAIWGCALVLGFMAFYYGILGLVAGMAVLLNFLFIFGALSNMGATLTLPGVAGLALNVGMSVDANIIIYERMKEELRRGASMIQAVKDGFANAFDAITDSNMVIILTSLVLMYFGTGPVRGFAVSLAIGQVVAMYTAVFFAKIVIETLVIKFKVPVLKASKAAV